MIAQKLFAILALFLLVAPVAMAQTNDEFAITDVDFDDPVEAGSTVELTVTLENLDTKYDVEDIELEAWIEDKFGERISNKAEIEGLQVQQDSDKDILVKLQMPEDAEEDDYTLFVQANGKWEQSKAKVSADYEDVIEVEQSDADLYVKAIKLSKTQYKAGENVDVALTVLNNGKEDLDNVAVTISVPEFDVLKSLNLFGTLYAGTEDTVYMTFKAPAELEDGIYTLKATASNDVTKVSATTDMIVKQLPAVETSNVKVSEVSRDLKVGITEEINLKVSNGGTATKTYAVTADSDTLNVAVEPDTFSLAPGQSKVVSVELKARESGKQTADIVVAENGVAISQMQVEADVAGGMSTLSIVLVALIVLLAGVAVFLQYGKGKSEKALYY